MRSPLLAMALVLSTPAFAVTFVNDLTVPNGVDLSGLPAGVTVPEKIEGLSFGPQLVDGGIGFLLVTDNDFSVAQNSSGRQFDVCTSGGASQVVPDGGCPKGQSLIPSYAFAVKRAPEETHSLGFSSATPVPEPANWAMIIAGFSFAGAALRQKHKRIRHATA